MNAIFKTQSQPLELVEIIDLKWMLAHEGHRVHAVSYTHLTLPTNREV